MRFVCGIHCCVYRDDTVILRMWAGVVYIGQCALELIQHSDKSIKNANVPIASFVDMTLGRRDRSLGSVDDRSRHWHYQTTDLETSEPGAPL